MTEVKTVQRGNSLALSLPKSDSTFKKGQTWLMIPSGEGYVLVPKIKNPYADVEEGSLYTPEEWPDFAFPEVKEDD